MSSRAADPHLTSDDRVLILAPHPDDETLAAGGLIQRAAAAGAAIRTVFATDGDNNPWVQRVSELRWHIGARERARFAARRRAEAAAAVAVLAPGSCETHFLHYPDQGLTARLLHGDRSSWSALHAHLVDWQPSVVVAPSLSDLHRDHNALAVAVALVLGEGAPPDRRPRLLSYRVHGEAPDRGEGRVLRLRLTPAERRRKWQAMRCHASQLVCHQPMFRSRVRAPESFALAPENVLGTRPHPVRDGRVERGGLRVVLAAPARTGVRGALRLCIVGTRGAGAADVRLALDYGPGDGDVAVHGIPGETVVGRASIEVQRRGSRVVVPLELLQGAVRVFVKLERRRGFFDLAGWRELRVDGRADG